MEVYFDQAKILFYFTSPNRVDFRDLVKDLVKNYRTRIELRQIGVRHETQMVGALGNCGMVCCCSQFLRRFAPVTIKMAKEHKPLPQPRQDIRQLRTAALLPELRAGQLRRFSQGFALKSAKNTPPAKDK